MKVFPEREEFLRLSANADVVSVRAEFTSDAETPLSAYAKLSSKKPAFLLESVVGGEHVSRYSFVGCDPRKIISCGDEETTVITRDGQRKTFPTPKDPLTIVEEEMGDIRYASPDRLPRFSGGAVGFIGYEYASRIEPTVQLAKNDDLGLPVLYFLVADLVLIFDHAKQSLTICANAYVGNNPEAAHSEAIQVVLSQRFALPYESSPIELYRAIRTINPSPYMFLLESDEFSVVGASPEVHVRLTGEDVLIRPIAGTRPRGADENEDLELEKELLADEKEKAEHLMLVDLARNDIGRVCRHGTVKAEEYMVIERYSHVMHIVSEVVGKLDADKNAFDLMRATFPAGTVSGAPKVRAMQIIAESEEVRRNVYAGALGHFGFDGNHDSCIAIRTAMLAGGTLHLQAGAGIVADSVPAKGMLKAIALTEDQKNAG